MSLKAKRIVIAVLGLIFMGSLLLVMQMEIVRKQEEAGLRGPHIVPPKTSEACVDCHQQETPGIVDQWKGSTHAAKGVACLDCHIAEDCFGRMGVDGHGLEALDRAVLSALARATDGTLGLKTLAASVGEAEDTIEEVYEPHLLRLGFIEKTSRGRTITDAGRAAIGGPS